MGITVSELVALAPHIGEKGYYRLGARCARALYNGNWALSSRIGNWEFVIKCKVYSQYNKVRFRTMYTFDMLKQGSLLGGGGWYSDSQVRGVSQSGLFTFFIFLQK